MKSFNEFYKVKLEYRDEVAENPAQPNPENIRYYMGQASHFIELAAQGIEEKARYGSKPVPPHITQLLEQALQLVSKADADYYRNDLNIPLK